MQPRAYYGLLRWMAEQRGLGVCHFADDVLLLGPDCDDAVAAAALRQRLAELQRQVTNDPVDPTLLDFLGPAFFQPQESSPEFP